MSDCCVDYRPIDEHHGMCAKVSQVQLREKCTPTRGCYRDYECSDRMLAVVGWSLLIAGGITAGFAWRVLCGAG